MSRVVCVGDLMIDVVAQLPGVLASGSDTPAPIDMVGGGAAANVAAWLADCGVPVTFVGRVGEDDRGRRAVADLAAAGVHPMVSVDPARSTGTCIVLVDPSGERTMVPDAGANSGLGEVPLTVLPAVADWLYVSGYALLNAGSRPFALAALEVARTRGWAIAVDAASAAPLTTVGADVFTGWLGTGVTLFANLDEARVLARTDDAEAAARVLARQVGAAVVKRGVAGAVWSDGAGGCSAPAAAARVLDSTGAGDAFAAGFLAARIAGAKPPAALAAGAVLAARALGRVGARPG